MNYAKTAPRIRLLVLALLWMGRAVFAQETVVEWVNEYRFLAGVDPVIESSQARVVAYEHNQLALDVGHAGHYYGFTGLGRALDRARVNYNFIAEVVAYYHYHEIRPQRFVEVFQTSLPHWNALMNPRYTHLCYHVAHRDGKSAITIYMIER